MSSSTPVAPPSTAIQPASGGAAPQQSDAAVLPNPTCLVQAAKLAIQQDKPIQLDYYATSATGKAFLGEDAASKEKVLVKSKDEFTSLVQKFYKVGEDFLIQTENSIYVVSGKIQKRKVNLAALQAESE
jgi:hypothetical protein